MNVKFQSNQISKLIRIKCREENKNCSHKMRNEISEELAVKCES